jgi:hypothetical protein
LDNVIGTLGIEPSVFWSLTFADLERLMFNHQIRDSYDWDRTRFISANILNSRMGIKKSQMVKPRDLIELPIDKIFNSTSKKKISKDEFLQNTKKMKKALPFKIA